MQLTELNKLVDRLAGMRASKDALKAELDEKRAEFEIYLEPVKNELGRHQEDIDAVQNQILDALRESGNKSWRTDRATVSRKTSSTYSVVDKASVLAFLAEKDLSGEYTEIALKPEIKGLYEQIEVPGVERIDKEYISVLTKKTKDDLQHN